MLSNTIAQTVLLGVIFIICITKVTSFPMFPGRKPDTKDDIESNTDTSPCSFNMTSVTPLNDSQKLELRAAMTDRTFLDRLEAFQKGQHGNMMISSEMQIPMVTLNIVQKRQILQNYRELFTKKPEEKTLQDFQNQGLVRQVSGSSADGDVTSTLRRSLKIREINQASGISVSHVQGSRVCQPVQAYESFVLALDENYDPVQIVQFPEDGLEQWILDETCASEDSHVSVARCGVATDRLVQAYVIDLNTEEMHLGKIRVHSCVGYV